MRSVLLPTLLNGKDHSRQEHVLSSNGIEKIQSHRILPSHRPPGEEGAIATIDWICSRPSPLREKSMPSEWPSSPPSHEIQHGEAAAMDPPPCLGRVSPPWPCGLDHGTAVAPSRPGMRASARGSAVRAGRDGRNTGV